MSDEIVREFLVESNENLDLLDRELVQLEKDPTNRERLASVFRTIHTIKGTCGFLGFTKLESVAHVGENLLSRMREGELVLNPEITTALLRMVDAIRQMLQSIEAIENEGERNDEDLIKTLTSLHEGKSQIAGEIPQPDTPALSQKQASDPAPPASLPQSEGSRPIADSRREASPVGKTEMREDGREGSEVSHPEASEAVQSQAANHGGVSDSSIRVDVVLLDKLMNLVGELVLARNQILQFTNPTEDAGFLAASPAAEPDHHGAAGRRDEDPHAADRQYLEQVSADGARCRDWRAASKCAIEMEGKETELDKTIIEAIKDPLTHIVRNSVDHGIETPDRRAAAGKPPEGRLLLRAFHEGGQVNIEISDDGAGLDSEKLRSKAVEKGLITAEQSGQDERARDRPISSSFPVFHGGKSHQCVRPRRRHGCGQDEYRENRRHGGRAIDSGSGAPPSK